MSWKTMSSLVLLLVVTTAPVVGQECSQEVGAWPYGPAIRVAVSGSHVYFSSGRVLISALIQSGSGYAKLDELVMPGVIGGIAVAGGYAYVGAGELRVVDISNPGNLVDIGGSATTAWPAGIAIVGSYAYLVEQYSGLEVFTSRHRPTRNRSHWSPSPVPSGISLPLRATPISPAAPGCGSSASSHRLLRRRSPSSTTWAASRGWRYQETMPRCPTIWPWE